MKAKIISRERMEELGRKHGVKILRRDHPVFSEGPSITFLRRYPRKKKGG